MSGRPSGWPITAPEPGTDAIAALEKSEATVPGLFTAANGFFLAMAYWQLGEKEKGREWYSKALQSVETASQPTRRELALFRLEASHLLGISDPKLPSSSRQDFLGLGIVKSARSIDCFNSLLEDSSEANLSGLDRRIPSWLRLARGLASRDHVGSDRILPKFDSHVEPIRCYRCPGCRVESSPCSCPDSASLF